jgi:GNAT superfamily N-acetyltransferase
VSRVKPGAVVRVLDIMRIRLAQAEDLDAAVRLLAAQFGEHDIALDAPELLEGVRGLTFDAGRGAVLIASDPEPVGVAVLAYTWTLEHGGLVAWLDELFVVPQHRGRGTGRALLRQAVEVARENGCRAVELEVDLEHARAERLYQREGFAVLPRRRWAKRLT